VSLWHQDKILIKNCKACIRAKMFMLPLGGTDVKPAVRRGIKYQLRICSRTENNHENPLKSETSQGRLMLFRETIAVYCEKMEHINTLCGKNAQIVAHIVTTALRKVSKHYIKVIELIECSTNLLRL
jgi:hypothetical protein